MEDAETNSTMNVASHNGSSEHQVLTKTVYNTLSECDLSPDLPDQLGPDVPDIRCLYGGSVFHANGLIWIEVETATSIQKPSSIIKRLSSALDADASLVYAVPMSDQRGRDGPIDTLTRILTDPPLVSTQSIHQTTFYTDTTRLLTTDGEYVAVPRAPLNEVSEQAWWRDHGSEQLHRNVASDRVITVEDPAQIHEGIPPSSAPYRVSRAPDADKSYRITESDGTERLSDRPDDDLVYLRRPIVPETLDIDIEAVLDEIQCLVVDENALYRQWLMYPREITEL